MAWPRVAVVVLNWNGLADTVRCLESLFQVSYPDYYVIVVDNGSANDEAGALQRRFGDRIVLIANDRNYGFTGGCNIGAARALELGCDYLLLLNNDTVVAPDFLEELVKAAEALPDAAALCPKVYFLDWPDIIYSAGGEVNLWLGRSRQVGRGQPDQGQFDRLRPCDYADGCCMLIPRRAWEAVGPLDDDYFTYWEETDWCFRARERGLRCYYVPTARIWHKAARSVDPDPRFYYFFRRNAILFLRKRGKPYHLATALAYHYLVLAPWFLLRHPRRWRRAFAEARALLFHLRRRPAGS